MMHDNWAEVSRQLKQELESERAQRQACRRHQQSFWSSLRHEWPTACRTMITRARAELRKGQTMESQSRSERTALSSRPVLLRSFRRYGIAILALLVLLAVAFCLQPQI